MSNCNDVEYSRPYASAQQETSTYWPQFFAWKRYCSEGRGSTMIVLLVNESGSRTGGVEFCI